jgi:beta-galactosidase
LIFGPRTAYRTPTGRVHEVGQPGPLRDLLGLLLLNFDGIPDGARVGIGRHAATIWAEGYRATSGTATQHYDDGPLAGQAAVIRNGTATTIGAWSATLIAEVLEDALQRAGIGTMTLPDGVRVSRRGSHEVWQNFNTDVAATPDGARIAPVSFLIR